MGGSISRNRAQAPLHQRLKTIKCHMLNKCEGVGKCLFKDVVFLVPLRQAALPVRLEVLGRETGGAALDGGPRKLIP